MRRHLLLVRHAKSAWNEPSIPDHDRELAPRGVGALPLLRDHLDRAEQRPDLVMCSSSRRTIDTLAGIRPIVSERALVRVEPRIYGASVHTLLELLRDLEDDIACAMLIGHNPGMQDLALLLAGAGESDTHAQLLTKFPTAAAVTLSFDRPWSQLGAGRATIDDLFMPRPPRP